VNVCCSGVVFIWFRLLMINQHIAMMLPKYYYNPFTALEARYQQL